MKPFKGYFVVSLLILILVCNARAVEIKSYKIVSEVEGVDVREDLFITLLNDGEAELKSATLTLPRDTDILLARDTYGNLAFSVEGERTKILRITFSNPVSPGEERAIILGLKASLVSRKEDYNEYLLLFNPRQDIGDFEHVLRLPMDAQLFSPSESFPAIVPEADIAVEGGFTVLTWKRSLEADHPEVFLVRYRSDSDSILDEIAYGFLAIILLVISFLIWREVGKRRRQSTLLKSLKILNERERRVIAEIVKSEGIRQRELMERLGYTKSSLSKIVSKLEARELIKKVKSGKINRLYPGERIK